MHVDGRGMRIDCGMCAEFLCYKDNDEQAGLQSCFVD